MSRFKILLILITIAFDPRDRKKVINLFPGSTHILVRTFRALFLLQSLYKSTTHPVLIKAHPSATDYIDRNTMARHSFKDVEVTRMLVRLARDGAGLVGVPHDDVSVWAHGDTALWNGERYKLTYNWMSWFRFEENMMLNSHACWCVLLEMMRVWLGSYTTMSASEPTAMLWGLVFMQNETAIFSNTFGQWRNSNR